MKQPGRRRPAGGTAPYTGGVPAVRSPHHPSNFWQQVVLPTGQQQLL